MDPLSCAGSTPYAPGERVSACPGVGTPATMYWAPVEGDTDDEGQPCAVYGVLCRACSTEDDRQLAWWEKRAAHPGDTVLEAGAEPDPTDKDLGVWIDEHGETASVPRRSLTFAQVASEVYIENNGRPAGTMVPYGDTMVEMPEGPEWDDVKRDEDVTNLAMAWFNAGWIEWAPELSPIDGSMYLQPTDEGDTAA